MIQSKDTDLPVIIRKYGLANAIKFEGKADARAVIGKLLAERPKLRSKAREITELVNEVVNEINKMPIESQITELQDLAPELLDQTKVQRVKELPPLSGAKKGKVVTRLPPEPSAYPHIGHAYAGYINWYYARKYEGRLILRFEDTNPRSVQEEYYEAFREGYRWMDIDWDEELKVSDDIPYFYDRAQELLERGEAYLCSCKDDQIKENRRTGTPCPHRKQSPVENLTIWKDILSGKYKEGEVVCRLRIDMTHRNAVMRDPNIFRIVDHPHPFQGDRFRLWPTYDFAVALEDHRNGISHILRSSEFASRGELQAYIRTLFKFPQPLIKEFSRFNIEGSPVGKRKIRPLIESGAISGWDDIRLTTIKAIHHRGIIPETVKELTREVGMSVAQPVIDWSVILGINRRLIDPIANRYYCTTNPIPITISEVQARDAHIPLHPDFKERGIRTIRVEGQVYIDGEDADRLKLGDVFRLKHLFNVRVTKKTSTKLEGEYAGEEIDQASLKIQWVTDDSIPIELRTPDVLFIKDKINPNSLQITEGLGEISLSTLEPGVIIQLERKGFGRVDENGEKVKINMTG